MRRTVLSLAAFAICFATQGFAQSSPPASGQTGKSLSAPDSHRKLAPAKSQQTPEVTLDASTLGSPLHLEKGWRIGITENTAPANPDFDDSEWSVRDAQNVFADVSDSDDSADKDQTPVGGLL